VISPSRDTLERTRARFGLSLEEAEVIPLPVPPIPNARLWRADGCDPERILFVGRFDRLKGGDTVIDAFVRLRRRHPRCKLTFVGPDCGLNDEQGRMWNILEYARKRLCGSDLEAFEWLGPRSREEIATLRTMAAATVVASRYENFAYAVLEAVSFGCPLVVTGVGGLPEIIEHGRNGLLCRPDDPDDLAEKLMSLLEDPGFAAELGAKAVEDSRRRFHPSVIAAKTLDYYQRVLKSVRHGTSGTLDSPLTAGG
jgi:glycosyltransferase involved in cell wall biosynthesis